MMDPDSGFQPPVNPIPPVIVLLTLIVVIVEGAFSLQEAGLLGGARSSAWRFAAIEDYGFRPLVLDYILARGDFGLDVTRRFVTYAFVHGSFTQALFAGALLLALGKFVGEAFRALPTLVIFFGSTFFGALAFGILTPDRALLFSTFTPIYGLIGAYTYVVWLRLGVTGGNRLNAFRMIGFLLGIQLVFGLIFGAGQMWIAEIAGFVAGFGLAVIAAPGGFGALLARMRARS